MLVGALRVFPRTVLPRHRPKSSMRQTGADSPAPSQTVHWTVCVPLWRGRGFESRHSVKNKKLFHQTVKELFVVGVTGFEPTASWSRTKRATNCATPRKEKPQQLGCCGVVGDERIELPRAESESAALPLCESPSGLCLGRLPSTLIYYSVPDGICQRFF